MQNMLLTFLACSLLSISTLCAQTIEIPFDGKSISIIGELKSLQVTGTNEQGRVIVETPESAVDYIVDGANLKLAFGEMPDVQITLPRQLAITCHPLPIVYEGSFDADTDFRSLQFSSLQGNVEVNADGFDVQALDMYGSLSIVTYGNIKASLPNPTQNSLVMLDTYLGNITLVLPQDADIDINATAKEGVVEKTPTLTSVQLIETKKGSSVRLHAEKGDLIELNQSKKVASTAKIEESRDKIDIVLPDY